jgi:hypothetical protein
MHTNPKNEYSTWQTYWGSDRERRISRKDRWRDYVASHSAPGRPGAPNGAWTIFAPLTRICRQCFRPYPLPRDMHPGRWARMYCANCRKNN